MKIIDLITSLQLRIETLENQFSIMEGFLEAIGGREKEVEDEDDVSLPKPKKGVGDTVYYIFSHSKDDEETQVYTGRDQDGKPTWLYETAVEDPYYFDFIEDAQVVAKSLKTLKGYHNPQVASQTKVED